MKEMEDNEKLGFLFKKRLKRRLFKWGIPETRKQLALSQKIAEDMINVIEHLTCAMDLIHCFVESQFKKKRKQIGLVGKVNEILISVDEKIESIMQRELIEQHNSSNAMA